ncbi:MAG: DNA-formamidopyrimidine glycosylase family protein [Thermoleophilaceae bacterium]
MPELPEVEIWARRLGHTLEGAVVESALAPGVVTMKTFDPPLSALVGRSITGVGRHAKMLQVDFSDDLSLLVHLMQGGRMRVFDKRASLRDKSARLLVRLEDGRELRLVEFGTKQRAWAKLLPTAAVAQDEMIATLGPEALPPPPADRLAELVRTPRHLHSLLRDQRVIAGIGRSWVDEILWEARLSPFQRGADLDDDAIERLHDAIGSVLQGALDRYEEVVPPDEVPDKPPMPLQVHKRQGEPCPRCGTKLEAVFFSEYVTTYCPEEQTGGRVLKDRRLSRLLK